ncbi:sensor histidine kinase [Arenibaculum pallidiluteum]|uniref:sensor histidine kinase n=1 Tax=Arenibaculum pallidiluteum TaxID=2812559 RepID=UPI001A96BB8B|nr:histidine kinase dimerization/phosphoacceptor domain -containing protein [Arenibaculum pallidiluteum]
MIVLHVDDNPDDRAMVLRGLTRAIPDAILRQVGTSEELDLAIAESTPDVSVIDFSLGWANGIEVFRRIRDKHPDCGVVMFTGSLGEEDAVEVMKAGLDDYVVKDPSRIPRLAAAVTSLARQAGERRARRRAEARHAAIYRSSGIGMFACRLDGQLLAANPALRRMLEMTDDADVASLNLFDFLNADGLRADGLRADGLRGDGLRDAWAAHGGVSIQGLEVTYSNRTKRTALLDAHAVPEADGEVECVLTDVTALRAAVERGDVLLRELYHRVYNNLQVIDAFLMLQARRFADPEVRAGFKKVSERIQALALIQQRLHQGNDFEFLEFTAYLRELTEKLAFIHGRPEIQIVVDAEVMRLPIDTAIPLGLIVTELLMNALKHAFPGGRAGRISVALHPAGDAARLEISDDGIGAPNDIYAPGTRQGGVGSRVVLNLVKQIDATVLVSTGDGTSVTVTVPLASPGGP